MRPKYVLGFLFDSSFVHVALIEKAKPEWQAGRLNGIGGHIEPGENAIDAMRREFREETNVDIQHWSPVCKLVKPDTADDLGWEMYVYKGVGNLEALESPTKEKVRILPVSGLADEPVIGNLSWLVPMALDNVTGSVTQLG